MNSPDNAARAAIDESMIKVERRRQGIVLSESAHGLKLEAITEAVLRSVGTLIICFCLLVWLIPPGMFFGNSLGSQVFLSLSALGIGLATYMVGTRGFLRGLEFDTARRRLMVQRINLAGSCRVAQSFPFDEIESLFVQRHGNEAELWLRRKTGHDISSIRGPRPAIESIHERLCIELRACSIPVRPRRPATQLLA